jgi:hypothetical protein
MHVTVSRLPRLNTQTTASWHRRTSEFVIFGVLQFGGVAINKLWQLGLTRAMGTKGYKTLANDPIYVSLARSLTFSWFAFTLFWLWATWKQLGRVFTALGVAQWLGIWLATWLFAIAVLALWEWFRTALLSIKTSEGPLLTSRYAHVVYATALGLVALVMTVLLKQPAPVFVYKTF